MSNQLIKEFTSPVLDSQLKEYNISCPLHFFAFDCFKDVMVKKGYEKVHPDGIYFKRDSRDLIFPETMDIRTPYNISVLTTLDFDDLEDIYYEAIREVYTNRYVLIEGVNSVRIQDSLKGADFETIRHTVPSEIVDVLENSLWNFEGFCSRFSENNISPTLGILLHGPPGVGKTFVLRSFFGKLIEEKGYTTVQIYQDCLNHINMSILLRSCNALFPCILFLEDIDMKYRDRQERIGTQAGFLLETFEGLSQVENIVLVATSNNVEVIEKALLRPGRIDYVMNFDNPSNAAKEYALDSYLEGLDINAPLHLREMLIRNSETFAELKGAVQHLLRTFSVRGEFPSIEEMTRMVGAWRETRLVGAVAQKEKGVGF